jgi:'Paired box' domain
MAYLTPDQLTAINTLHISGMNPAKIVRVLNIGDSTVRKALGRKASTGTINPNPVGGSVKK